MGKKPHKRDSITLPRESSTALLMVATYADTTWRMFVPSIGFTLLGVWFDGLWGSKPWLMLIGIIIGCTLAVLLVKRQFERVKRS